MDSERDEQLAALQSQVKNAESKLKSAEISVKDIDDKLKTNQEMFEQKLSAKSQGYKEQTGADFSRVTDANGRVSYEFTRSADTKEQKQKRKLYIKREVDSVTGKRSYKAEFVTEPEDMTVNINSEKDLKKPEKRKKFIAVSFFGYRRIELDTYCNPILKGIAAPIVVPIQIAAKITRTAESTAKYIADSSVGRGVADAAKIVSAPIVIPAKVVKNIADKGGVIHSVVDLGSKIQIEGVYNPVRIVTDKLPQPVKSAGTMTKSAVIGAALGTETVINESAKGIGKFSIEIAKNKIYEEINKGIAENDGSQAAYIIGMKMIDVYKILDEHSKYKRAVRRDKAGNDIADPNVSRYLAEKSEKKHEAKQDKLKEEKAFAEHKVNKARDEYEAAKSRLEKYQKANGIETAAKSPEPVAETAEKLKLSKGEKQIQKTKRKLKSVKSHKYKLHFRQVFKRNAWFGKGAMTGIPRLRLEREEITDFTPATALNTKRKLENLTITDTAKSLRRKAMRDGGDNTAIEAADFAITAAQAGNRFIKYADKKEKQLMEKKLEKKLEKLESQNKLHEKIDSKPKEQTKKPKSNNKKKNPAPNKELQKKNLKRKKNKKIHSQYLEKSKQAAKDMLYDAANAVINRSRSVGVLLLIFVGFFLPMSSMTMCGGGSSAVLDSVVSPCSTNDLGLCDRYYTELGKNMIDMHQNIESYYQGYNKYICLTDITEISHSPEKLLPYLAVKVMSDSGEKEWNYEQAKPYIENIFNAEYEFYTNEIHEVRKKVSTTVYTNEQNIYSALGTSEYTLERPSDSIPNPLTSYGYRGYANTYTHVEVPILSGYIENTLDNVGVLVDKDTGAETEFDEAQTITFSNKWTITLIFDWIGDSYQEYWKYTEEQQDFYEYDYYALEYGIKEKNIEVDEKYWTETDYNWQDNNFDKLIYNLVSELDESGQKYFNDYSIFLMGHQRFRLPFDSAEISKYPGYGNIIGGDTSLDYSMELKTYPGQEIICGMDGTVSSDGGNGFSIYNKKYGTLYYEYADIPSETKVEKGKVISSSTGNVLRITFIDNDGNYLNPLFIFS